MKTIASIARRLALLAVVALPLAAQQPKYDPNTYVHTSADVPMRDGLTLHVEMFSPKDATEPLPFLFQRTPYGVGGAGGRLTGGYKELAEEGYIFVFQDIRGRYKSQGTFVMQRPPRPVDSPSQAIDESTDTHDSIEWLLKNVPRNNGRVGMLGVSYDGWTAAMGMLGAHPALKAVSPQASPADMWMGDDFHHNGAFRLSYGFEYAYLTEASKENSDFAFDKYDTYEWYLNLGPLSNVQTKVLGAKTLPTWTDFSEHPNYDAFWQRQAMKPYLTRVTTPTLNVGGWWDQEDFYGPLTIYRELEKHDQANRNFLVVGPWRHGGGAPARHRSSARSILARPLASTIGRTSRRRSSRSISRTAVRSRSPKRPSSSRGATSGAPSTHGRRRARSRRRSTSTPMARCRSPHRRRRRGAATTAT